MSNKSIIDELMDMAEQFVQDKPEKEEVADPLAKLSPEEVRKRFDKYGNPKEGYDADGNPIGQRQVKWD